ncbi:hypothetical protein M9458_056060, partial [Cirrhinus mrigala]
MVEEGLMTPGGRPTAVEQVVVNPEGGVGEPVSQGDVEDLEGQGGAGGKEESERTRGTRWSRSPEVADGRRLTK